MNAYYCKGCDKVLSPYEYNVCTECSEYMCSECGQEWDVEYGICACGNMDPELEWKADLISDLRKDK